MEGYSTGRRDSHILAGLWWVAWRRKETAAGGRQVKKGEGLLVVTRRCGEIGGVRRCLDGWITTGGRGWPTTKKRGIKPSAGGRGPLSCKRDGGVRQRKAAHGQELCDVSPCVKCSNVRSRGKDGGDHSVYWEKSLRGA